MSKKTENYVGYLPDESPSFGKLILFAFQQILVMFPATVTVALLTGFHVSTTIFASGFATLCFIFITKRKIPLYYGSSFSYISAICGITLAEYGVIAPDELIAKAQFGIIASGLVSIVAGVIISKFGQKTIEKILPPTVTGTIAMVIGLSLAGVAFTSAVGYDAVTNTSNNLAWLVSMVTLVSTVLFSVYLKKGVLGQIPILLGIAVGYVFSLIVGIQIPEIIGDQLFALPHFTLPIVSWEAVLAVMPIAIATIPESTAHLYQLDIYVNDLSKKKGGKKYEIENKLGLNLIGDGICDMISASVGGPAGTNYGENLSTMAITRNFSIKVLGAAAVITMFISFFTPLTNFVNSVPSPVINGACIYLFGVIAAQGLAIMVNKEVDFFDSRNLAIIAIIAIIGIGGTYAFPNGLIPFMGFQLPAIATASIFGIIFNLILNFGKTSE